MNWQSSSVNPPALSRATRCASATFDASVARLNIDSPKKARPSFTPYSPPTRFPFSHVSMLCACPPAWSSATEASIWWFIQVEGRSAACSAHIRTTSPNALSAVVSNRPDRSVLASERESRKLPSGSTPRFRGSTQ
jgi:hypothetical protein